MSGWGRLTFLVVLAAATALLPQRLASRFAVGEKTGENAPAEPSPSGPEPSQLQKFMAASLGADAAAMLGKAASQTDAPKAFADDINRALNERAATEQLSQDERQLSADSKPKVEVLSNPVLERLLKMSAPPRERAAAGPSMKDRLRAACDRHGPLLASAITIALVSALGLALLAILCGFSEGGRFFAGLCHGLAGKLLWLLSLAAVAAFIGWRVDFWSVLPPQLWGVPAAIMLASAAVLCVVDMNTPVWNGMSAALLAPLFSCGVVLSLNRMFL